MRKEMEETLRIYLTIVLISVCASPALALEDIEGHWRRGVLCEVAIDYNPADSYSAKMEEIKKKCEIESVMNCGNTVDTTDVRELIDLFIDLANYTDEEMERFLKKILNLTDKNGTDWSGTKLFGTANDISIDVIRNKEGNTKIILSNGDITVEYVQFTLLIDCRDVGRVSVFLDFLGGKEEELKQKITLYETKCDSRNAVKYKDDIYASLTPEHKMISKASSSIKPSSGRSDMEKKIEVKSASKKFSKMESTENVIFRNIPKENKGKKYSRAAINEDSYEGIDNDLKEDYELFINGIFIEWKASKEIFYKCLEKILTIEEGAACLKSNDKIEAVILLQPADCGNDAGEGTDEE